MAIAIFFMTAPENMQNLPCGLPGGCYRFSTVKGKAAWKATLADVRFVPLADMGKY
jgi:hypothetical protein